MKLVVIGTGQGGCNIADEFVALGKWVYKNRGKMRIFSGKGENPAVSQGVFAVNLADKDLRGMRNIPPTEDYSILLGTTDEFRGRGAGKVNTDGAEQARRGTRKIMKTITAYSNVASADAVLVIATTAGGTGSGAVGVIVDAIKEQFETKPVYAMLVLPIEKEYSDPDSMINTATCLKRVINRSKADGVILVDNQKLIEGDLSSGDSLRLANRKIVNNFMDILCVGGETKREFIGEMLDANDVIRNVGGITAVGIAHEIVPKKKPFLNRLLKGGGVQDIQEGTDRDDRARNALDNALRALSVHCEYREDGVIRYNAKRVLYLLSGPRGEITEDVLEMADDVMSERVPGAGRKKGTYPGRTSDSISATVILSGIAQGAAMDLVTMFYERGKAERERLEAREKAAEAYHEAVAEVGKDLPEL